MIASAYHHAGLYLHPAFNELPGAIFLEAARFGTPTIASTSCTINDYFYDPIQKHSRLDGRIAYCDPCDFAAIKDLTEQLFGKKFPPLLIIRQYVEPKPISQATLFDLFNQELLYEVVASTLEIIDRSDISEP